MIPLLLALALLTACAPTWQHGPPGPTPYDSQAWESGRAGCAERGLEYDGKGCLTFEEFCRRQGGIGVIQAEGHRACVQPMPGRGTQ